LRLTLISAVDDKGTNLDNWTGSWDQHRFWKMLKLERTATLKAVRIHATVAIHENYDAEFMLQPRYEREAKP
jgi:hypothetical protein